MATYKIPLIGHGKLIEDYELEFRGRNGGTFLTPDPKRHVDKLVLGNPQNMADLYQLRFDEVIDYLDELGRWLQFDRNAYVQEAYAVSCETSGLTPSILEAVYRMIPDFFRRESTRQIAECGAGIRYLDGWAEEVHADGRRIAIRALGSRAVHVVAGNAPVVSLLTVIRNALTRGDAIVKSPSNDPFTNLAFARTMLDMAPDHPLTKHYSVAYWKGGDAGFEEMLYQPRHVELICAWGGDASIRHIARHLQPGIDLLTMDPKQSCSIIDARAIATDGELADVAARVALDIGMLNQEACSSTRVVYFIGGTDAAAIARANQFGRLVYAALQELPPQVSTPVREVDPELMQEIEGLHYQDDYFKLIGCKDNRGGVIVSQLPECVDFRHLLGGRIANVVPVDSCADVLPNISAYTQTISIYPEAFIEQVRLPAALHGAQHFKLLGYGQGGDGATPQDGREPLRRMCKWVYCEFPNPVTTRNFLRRFTEAAV